MRILGIELTGNDAVVALLEQDNGMFYIPDFRARKVNCRNPDDQEQLQYFQKSFAQLVQDYKVDEIVIRGRMKKGRFAGGANGFKLEGALQVLPSVKVTVMIPATQSAILKRFPMSIPFAETGMKKFQQQAFEVAYAQLSDPKGLAEAARQKEIANRKQKRDERVELEEQED
ncbi:DUF3010 family protein [Thiomicrorhabdus indica]|uniref:DUF3010 family protein n=1 Tax=Thiomicrorhabdus indica TaxID=2267253 RepID=UPI002AA826F7|nr:DUF3010 family protein [Thiomicrorhabdus indica]